jgi:uncharacterized protein
MPLFRPQAQRFLMSELALDPATLLTSCTKPVLVIQGLRDFKSVYPRAELVLVANAHHVLNLVRTADRNENVAVYSDPERPLADHVVEAISTFVRSRAVSQP